jgi:murein peptide amidase A
LGWPSLFALVLALAATGAFGGEDNRRLAVGSSVEKRAITAFRQGSRGAPIRILVVGQLHGDEPGGVEVVKALRRLRAPRGVAVWTVRSINPDGAERETRKNAREVDLNRNFPRGWRPSRRESRYYGGRRPLSQPESRAAARLIRRLRPDVTVWYHEPYDFVVEAPGTDPHIWRRYARLADMDIERLPKYPGTATRWQNHRFPLEDAFVVELPGRRVDERVARRHARAVVELGRWMRRNKTP